VSWRTERTGFPSDPPGVRQNTISIGRDTPEL
jgi:hypothetical protein